MAQGRYGRHVRRDPHVAARGAALIGLLVVCVACIAAWFACNRPWAGTGADNGPERVALHRGQASGQFPGLPR